MLAKPAHRFRHWDHLLKCSIALIATGLAVALAVLASAAQAEPPSRLDQIVKRGTLRVGLTGDYAPFSLFDSLTGKFEGFDVDMAEALGKAIGVKVEFVKTAWPQLARDFEADNFD